jgi:hypothetical protein
MSEQFFYVYPKFLPKIVTYRREVVVDGRFDRMVRIRTRKADTDCWEAGLAWPLLCDGGPHVHDAPPLLCDVAAAYHRPNPSAVAAGQWID